MRLYVEMSEEEYDFYKKFKSDKQIVKNNLCKIFLQYNKGLTDREKSIFGDIDRMLFRVFEIIEAKENI